jgi:ABC-2 type transport system permease protein
VAASPGAEEEPFTITSEYATGSIRPTLAAAPQRGTVLAAKAAVFGSVATGTCACR